MSLTVQEVTDGFETADLNEFLSVASGFGRRTLRPARDPRAGVSRWRVAMTRLSPVSCPAPP